MITLKLPYMTDNMSMIQEYRRQYNLCFRYLYNRIYDSKGTIKEKELRSYHSNINNIDNIGCWLFQSCVRETLQTYKIYQDKKIIFGTKKAFKLRCQNKITKEEFKSKRLRSIYSIGETSHYGNRLFRIDQNLDIVFQPNRNIKINLSLRYKNPILSKLYQLQQENKIALTYTLNDKFICITYDEKLLENYSHRQIKDRVLALDLNPNYVGLSIVDWKSSSNYSLVFSKTIDLSKFDNKKNLNSKKEHELKEIAKWIVDLAIHYQCSILSIEDLDIKNSDKGNGKHFNRLCNNIWLRNVLVSQLVKRTNIHNIRMIKVKPEFSSFIGNILFREEQKPDMVLASIEIGRRGYEFNIQWIEKTKQKKKNIIFPDLEDFRRQYIKSMEEFDILDKINLSLKELYSYIKKAKMMYRFPLDKTKVFKFRSKHFFTKVIE